MNARHALANLVAARTALGEIGVRPFLVDGTLLGAVREGGFIAHDRDLDMGIFAEELRADIPQAMGRHGFKLRRTFGTPDRGYEMSFRRFGIKLDIFVYYADEDGGRFHAAWPSSDAPIRYRYAPFALAPLSFLGQTFLAHENPVLFLETKYGPEWRTPVVQWDWRWGPKNAEPWSVTV